MQSPVFLVNSRLSLVSVTVRSSHRMIFTGTALLLPKLRSQLAEFLNDSFSTHLSLLSLTTCVGFGYGRVGLSLAAFLGSLASTASLLMKLRVGSQLNEEMDLPVSSVYFLAPALPSAGLPSFLRHCVNFNDPNAGQKYHSAVHRLRLSASS